MPGLDSQDVSEVRDEAEDVFVFPASFAQERLWFLDQLDPGSSVYLLPRSYYFNTPVDAGTLERSLNEIVRRHEVLRTHFARVSGAVMQVVAPVLNLPLPLVDLRSVPESIRGEELQRIVQQEAQLPFDLGAGPLLRARLVSLRDDAHVLLLTMHHIVSDAWSCDILFHELTTLYGAYAAGNASPLLEPPVQYGDFARWQREWLTGEVLEDHVDYWRRQLAGASAVLELPSDRPRAPAPSFRGATIGFGLSDVVAERLKALTRQENATLFMTLLSAFMALLHRYTAQDDIVVGSPIANRNRPEIEELIGFFVNTLTLRANFIGDLSFRQLLQQIREVTLDAYAHQDLPFEKLVRELRPARHASHNPLFQVMFVHQLVPAAATPSLSGQAASETEMVSQPFAGTAKFDLTMFVFESGSQLSGAIEYNTDLFDAARMVRLIGHFRTLLAAIANEPDRPVSLLPLLTAPEIEQFRALNATSCDYGAAVGIPALFEAQVERIPNATAVIFDGQSLTYRELNRRANQLGQHLRRLGVGPETRVAVCLRRSADMAVALLGVLKAGGAYVPLDPTYPGDRLAFIIRHAGAPVLITNEDARDALPSSDRVVSLDRDTTLISAECEDNPPNAADPDNLVYVIYTSGSTGTPKGVAMAHRPLFNLLRWQVDDSKLPDEARTLQYTSLNFDVSFQEIFSTWCGGGTLVMIDDDIRLDPARLSRCIVDMAIARIFIPPVVLSQLAETFAGTQRVPATLRQIMVAGEQLHITPAVAAFCAQLPNGSLRNHYGPTETHLATHFIPVGAPNSWPSLPPIGIPIANLQMHILDRNLQPVPVGVLGQLYIGGAGLARGYLGHPEWTAERFIPDPFSAVPGARLYKTGDRARYSPDGYIEFFGRIDDQVKIRGFRIEPGEVKAVLQRHAAVRECAVTVGTDSPGDTRLVAYVVPWLEEAPTTAELRRFLGAALPEYMVPASFVFLDALPQLPNGKLDRNALPAPDGARPLLKETFVAPANPTEAVLADIWAEVLRVAQVGSHDNFFELGGHSLLATQVVSRIRLRLQVELPLRRLFEGPTIVELAVIVAELAAKQSTQSAHATHSAGGARPEEILARLEQLSDAEVEALLDGL
jgi:amino acid adenylation domain-containing protein